MSDNCTINHDTKINNFNQFATKIPKNLYHILCTDTAQAKQTESIQWLCLCEVRQSFE